ncbi:hypothetical protein T01_11701 [Trichinella spiralis]|uniref:Uncharacterized protein n=1 Tax=Trichinella spiralis TaxID=6334 RepID=A0A0V1B7G8_TRISP|nr:hypothetical protein T01_11701 [Trichinella spiralis]
MALPSIPMLMSTKPMIQPIFGRLTLLTQFSMFPAEQANFSAQIAGYRSFWGKKVGQVLTGQVLNGAVSTRPY